MVKHSANGQQIERRACVRMANGAVNCTSQFVHSGWPVRRHVQHAPYSYSYRAACHPSDHLSPAAVYNAYRSFQHSSQLTYCCGAAGEPAWSLYMASLFNCIIIIWHSGANGHSDMPISFTALYSWRYQWESVPALTLLRSQPSNWINPIVKIALVCHRWCLINRLINCFWLSSPLTNFHCFSYGRNYVYIYRSFTIRPII